MTMYTLYVKNGIHSVYIGLNGDEYYDRAKTPEKIYILYYSQNQSSYLMLFLDVFSKEA